MKNKYFKKSYKIWSGESVKSLQAIRPYLVNNANRYKDSDFEVQFNSELAGLDQALQEAKEREASPNSGGVDAHATLDWR